MQKTGSSIWIKLTIFAVVVMVGGAFLLRFPQLQNRFAGASKSSGEAAQATREISKVPAKSSGVVTISIASSNTKEGWLHKSVERFNSGNDFQVDGKKIKVEILQEVIDGKSKDYRSGTMISHTLTGKIKPTIVSPGSPSYIEKLKKEWMSGSIINSNVPIVVRTPVVLAMWQSRAKMLGAWPQSGPNNTWSQIRELAESEEGWGKYGHSEWGKFKIGYGYFDVSNSGQLGVIAMFLAGEGKKDLKIEDISAESPGGQFIGGIEKAKCHSGKSDLWLLERMIDNGPEYLDAVITYESNIIDINRQYHDRMREPLVAFYPQDGTFMAEHPLAILDGAPWNSKEQVEAAKVFCDFLMAQEQQKDVMELGLRSSNPDQEVVYPVDPEFGANPKANIPLFSMPSTIINDRIGEIWHRVKKHAFIALVFDKSGSMKGQKMNAAIKGAEEFINSVDLEDHLLWVPFDDRQYGAIKEGSKRDIGEELIQDYVRTTTPDGGTALYDTVISTYNNLLELRKQYGDHYRYGIVVLSDGDDRNSKQSLTMLEEKLRPLENDPTGIQMHTIGIGDDCDVAVLKKIAKAAHGKYWKGNTYEEMKAIYKDIATHY